MIQNMSLFQCFVSTLCAIATQEYSSQECFFENSKLELLLFDNAVTLPAVV
eukprot:m.15773 g.15773  ORF g.15773 m.15773 type:complete len:51 (-) comp10741_c0_seq1:165-317(-)